MNNTEFVKYFGPGDTFAETNPENGNRGLTIRLGKVMIERLETAEAAISELLPAVHVPFSMGAFQILEKLEELGLPPITNPTEDFGFYTPPANLPVPFAFYGAARAVQFARRLNRIKGTFRALRALMALVFVDLVEITEDAIDGKIPFDSGTVGGTEIKFDQPGRRWDSCSCDRCIDVTVRVRWLAGVPNFTAPEGLAGLTQEQIDRVSQQIYRILEWGLPVDCRIKQVLFIDTPIFDPDLRAFTEGFNLGFL